MYQQNENNHLEIDHVGRAYILETVRWTKFLAILGFIVMGLVFISGLLLAVVMPSLRVGAKLVDAVFNPSQTRNAAEMLFVPLAVSSLVSRT